MKKEMKDQQVAARNEPVAVVLLAGKNKSSASCGKRGFSDEVQTNHFQILFRFRPHVLKVLSCQDSSTMIT